ncbi:MAG: glycosyltransferase family 4 protein [Vicinamibacteria bacterium]
MRSSPPLRVLQVIHDYLPRHRAGSEIYAQQLSLELQAQGLQVMVLSVEYDASRPHGSLVWRSHEGLPVVELINNWRFSSFDESFRASRVNQQLEHVLRALQPDLLHIHSLLNLSLDLPTIAASLGIRSVATLHDYTLLCPSGGQLVHREGREICWQIDPGECARCFPRSPFATQMALGGLNGSSPRMLRLGARLRRSFPRLSTGFGPAALQRVAPVTVSPEQINLRLDSVRRVFETVDRFVSPSSALADYFHRFGLPAEKIEIADYGFRPLSKTKRRSPTGHRLRIGFVGTLVWHKGLHVLLEAIRGLPPDAYEVLVFGDPSTFPNYVKDLEKTAEGLPVRFKGPFSDHDQVSDVYDQIDLLVVPSLWPENSPLVIHEAFMAGVPVIGSRLGGIADLVRHGECGLLFDPVKPSHLTAALRSVVDEPGILSRWAHALPAVRTMEDDARQWCETYRAVLERARMRDRLETSA